VSIDTAPQADEATVDELDRRGRHTARWISVIVGVLLAGFIAFLFTRDTGERSNDSPLLGELVPPVTGSTLDGGSFDIDDIRGQWVAVNFFASWCGPCRQEHPELVEFAERHAGPGDASVVSIAFDDREDDARAFFEELGGDWPVLVTDTAGTGVDFGVTGVPETYLVAPNGTVVAKWAEPVTADALDAVIAQLTSGASPASNDEGSS
jgi:cytochrome c biogenesis protein CcmG/thiol:disulfide interchange protein DsbE